MSKTSLLTPAASNPKTAKGHALPYEAAILHLSPARKSGYNACSHASIGCEAVCLDEAGHGGIGGPDNVVQRARIRKTKWYFEDRSGFMAQLVREISNLEKRARKKGLLPALRLNGTSDLGWVQVPCVRDGVTYRNVFDAFPNVTFYDYTKVPSRYKITLPKNYFVTFSLSESNDAHAADALAAGMNVAAVLKVDDRDDLPAFWSGYPVLDGTAHDFRFLDPQGGHIVALRAKGAKAKADTSGFVRALSDTLDVTKPVVLAVSRPYRAAA
jgi:hypothetical protein